MTDEKLIELVKHRFENEYSVMEVSLINYYDLKSQTDLPSAMLKVKAEILLNITLLMRTMGHVLVGDGVLDMTVDEFYTRMCTIHLKL
jgi:hypothetical protein